jgi:hypothetical protein
LVWTHLELKCKSYERNKKQKKEILADRTKPGPAGHPRAWPHAADNTRRKPRSSPARARPTPFFFYLFSFFRTYLYIALTSVHLSFFPRNPKILSPETLTSIFEPLNFVICLRPLNKSCRSRWDASIPTNLISFRPP